MPDKGSGDPAPVPQTDLQLVEALQIQGAFVPDRSASVAEKPVLFQVNLKDLAEQVTPGGALAGTRTPEFSREEREADRRAGFRAAAEDPAWPSTVTLREDSDQVLLPNSDTPVRTERSMRGEWDPREILSQRAAGTEPDPSAPALFLPRAQFTRQGFRMGLPAPESPPSPPRTADPFPQPIQMRLDVREAAGVDLHVRGIGAEIQVTVRGAVPGREHPLQSGLDSLVTQLKGAGFDAGISLPEPTALAAHASEEMREPLRGSPSHESDPQKSGSGHRQPEDSEQERQQRHWQQEDEEGGIP
jgi:hypothetical protein